LPKRLFLFCPKDYFYFAQKTKSIPVDGLEIKQKYIVEYPKTKSISVDGLEIKQKYIVELTKTICRISKD